MRSTRPISYSIDRMCGYRTPATMKVRCEAQTFIPVCVRVATMKTPAGPTTRWSMSELSPSTGSECSTAHSGPRRSSASPTSISPTTLR